MCKKFKACCVCFGLCRPKASSQAPPEDIKDLFERYGKNGRMSMDGLQMFLVDIQGQANVTKDDAQAIFNSLKHLNNSPGKGLNLDSFFRYLISDLNPPISSRVHHNMNLPLAHYFVFTGHNSYLTGDKLTSDSSVQPIVNSLLRGVRAIELDLWPDSKNNGIEVRHQWTVTRPVELIQCLRAIKTNAFVASEYPVVITFENHLPADLQAQVVKMVVETFGSTLYCPESEWLMKLPSPEQLKRKILISTKPQEYQEVQTPIKESGASEHKGNIRDDNHDEDEEFIPEFKQLIAIHNPESGKDIWKFDPTKVWRLSLSEQELENAAKSRGADIVRFTQRNLLRVYPKCTVVDLSTYDPMLGWMHGAQMVAFNMQGHDKYLWIMEGMFRANGGCGYVKKPDFLLDIGPNDEVFNPHIPLPVRKNLKVKVYMGEGWYSELYATLSSPPGFYVMVGIAGVPNDTKSMKTKAIGDRWVPVWNEEFNFPLSVPELAVLQMEAKTSEQHDNCGQACLPVPELATGIRAVTLHNKRGEKYRSIRLLLRFEFE